MTTYTLFAYLLIDYEKDNVSFTFTWITKHKTFRIAVKTESQLECFCDFLLLNVSCKKILKSHGIFTVAVFS